MIEPRTQDSTGASSERWQECMYRFVKSVKPSVVVETGYSEGLSAEWILAAMDEVGVGHLHSIDVGPQKYKIEHPRLTFHLGKSRDVLPVLFAEIGQCDIFIHDSDHEEACQTFEYEAAWHAVIPGGYIFSDDTHWGTPPHNAWAKFLERYKLNQHELGYLRYVQKPIQ